YAEMVIPHRGSNADNLGPPARGQAAGGAVASHSLWWASRQDGVNTLYRIDADGSHYSATPLIASSAVTDGDRLRLIARGPVVYGLKNGVREFIYNTGPDRTRQDGGGGGGPGWAGGGTPDGAGGGGWVGGAAAV